jgi:phosphoglycerate dehydrogenase-like enzyme
MSQHSSVTAQEVVPVANWKPLTGSIAILPEPIDSLEAAVVAGGGAVNELSTDTSGLIWRGYGSPDDLATVLDENPGIRWVQLPLAGIEQFAPALQQHPDLVWTSAKGAFAQPVAEHALALTLALLRELPRRILATSWAAHKSGTSLYGLRVLIIGAGGIAVELMRLLAPFGAHVTVVRRSADPLPGADRTVSADHLLDVLPEADVVVIAAAATAGTANLIGETELRIMKDTAILVNIARGSLVDTDALAGALASRQIAGAGIDVTAPEPLPDGHPLWDEPNLIITPHTADTPEMMEPLVAERVRLNVVALRGDGRFVGVVDAAAGY